MTWKEKLAGKVPRALADEIDVYETQLELRKLGKIDEKLFAETRLRRGATASAMITASVMMVSRRSN